MHEGTTVVCDNGHRAEVSSFDPRRVVPCSLCGNRVRQVGCRHHTEGDPICRRQATAGVWFRVTA